MEERPGPDLESVREEMRNEREEMEGATDDGPDASELDEDPAHNPDDDELKDIKGG